jgi:hypothetical protein
MVVVCPPPTVHLAVCPNPQCQSLVRYGVQVLLICQFEVGLRLELAAFLIDFRAPGIVAAVVHTPFVTFAVIVIVIPTAATAGKEKNNIGN